MARVAGPALLAFALLLGVAAFVIFIWEQVEECGTTADAFWYWQRTLVPFLALGVMVTSLVVLLSILWERNQGRPATCFIRSLRFLHVVVSILVFVFLVVSIAFYAVDMGTANKAPTLLEGGRFDNPANDDRYCCVFGGSAQPGDCPPVHLGCRNLTDICAIAVTQADLGWGREYLFDFSAAVTVAGTVLMVLVLSLVLQCQVGRGTYWEDSEGMPRYSNARIGQRIPPLRPPARPRWTQRRRQLAPRSQRIGRRIAILAPARRTRRSPGRRARLKTRRTPH